MLRIVSQQTIKLNFVCDNPWLLFQLNTMSSTSDSQAKEQPPWKALLPFISEEMAGPIFSCFLKRAVAIMSTVVPILPPLRDQDVLSRHPAMKLVNVMVGLRTLYENAIGSQQIRMILGLILDEKPFVYFVIQLSCQVMQLEKGKNLRL